MELALNLAWALLAVSTLGLWLRFGPRTERQRQFVALTMLLLILFPVISVTDDLQLPLNPAEADCCLRRDQVVTNPNSILPFISGLPEACLTCLFSGSPRLVALGTLSLPMMDEPALAPIQGRAPPAA